MKGPTRCDTTTCGQDSSRTGPQCPEHVPVGDVGIAGHCGPGSRRTDLIAENVRSRRLPSSLFRIDPLTDDVPSGDKLHGFRGAYPGPWSTACPVVESTPRPR